MSTPVHILPVTEELLEAALDYASRGLAIFPLVPGGKTPYRSTNGLKDATTDQATIRAWWGQWPTSNIGLVVPAGHVVVDLDTYKEGGVADVEALTPLLAASRTVETGRGGLHFWYTTTVDQSTLNSTPFPCVELRKAGTGYVVAPPSVTEGVYSWWHGRGLAFPVTPLPVALLARIQRPASAPQEVAAPRGASTPGHWYEQALTRLSEGADRNNTGLWLCQQLRDDGQSEEGARTWMRRYQENVPAGDHPYSVAEALATVRQVFQNQTPRPPAQSQVRPSLRNTPPAQTSSVFSEAKRGEAKGMKEGKNERPPTGEGDQSQGLGREPASTGEVAGLSAEEVGDFFLERYKDWPERLANARAIQLADALPATGVVQHKGSPAQQRRNAHYCVLSTAWRELFPGDAPLSAREMSTWVCLAARDEGGVGDEGMLVLDRIYSWYDAPHKGGIEGIRAPRGNFKASLERDTRPAPHHPVKEEEEEVGPV